MAKKEAPQESLFDMGNEDPFGKPRRNKPSVKKRAEHSLSAKDQGVLIRPDTDWCPPVEFPSLAGAKYIAIDLETKDPQLTTHGPGWPTRNGYVVGISVCTDDGFNAYYPFDHGEEWDRSRSGNLDKDQVVRWARDQFKTEQPKIFANTQYDVGWLRTLGITVGGPWYDVAAAVALLDENRMYYNLDSLARDYTDVRKDNKLLEQANSAWGFGDRAGKNLWRLPAPYVGPYAEGDTLATKKVWDAVRPMLEAQNLWELFELESSLIPMLDAMRTRGMRVDVDACVESGKYFLQRGTEITEEISKRWCPIDLWEANSLARAFAMENIKLPKTKTGRPSVTKDWLADQMLAGCKLAELILKGRRYDFARRTFIEGNILGKLQNGRVYAETHSLRSDEGGTVSGRFSYSHPNLQQIPARDPEIGPRLRSLFLPEPGQQWLADDYSQQEPRLVVHYASLAGCAGAEDARRYYCEDPKPDFHTLAVKLFEAHGKHVERSRAKILNLGLFYGMGIDKLSYQLGTDRSETEEVVKQYHDSLPFVRDLTRMCSKEAQAKGYVYTILKRRCRFDRWEPRRSWDERKANFIPSVKGQEAAREKWGRNIERSNTHKAMNRVIQGSAADQTKLAMSLCWKEGIMPTLQVHDELMFSIDPGDVKTMTRIKDIMEGCITLRVPVKVEMKLGDSWGEASAVKDFVPWTPGETKSRPKGRRRKT